MNLDELKTQVQNFDSSVKKLSNRFMGLSLFLLLFCGGVFICTAPGTFIKSFYGTLTFFGIYLSITWVSKMLLNRFVKAKIQTIAPACPECGLYLVFDIGFEAIHSNHCPNCVYEFKTNDLPNFDVQPIASESSDIKINGSMKFSLSKFFRHDYYSGLLLLFTVIFLLSLTFLISLVSMRRLVELKDLAEKWEWTKAVLWITGLLVVILMLLIIPRIISFRKKHGLERSVVFEVFQHIFLSLQALALGSGIALSFHQPITTTVEYQNTVLGVSIGIVFLICIVFVTFSLLRIRKAAKAIESGHLIEGVITGNIYTEIWRPESKIMGGGMITFAWELHGEQHQGFLVTWNSETVTKLLPNQKIMIAADNHDPNYAVILILFSQL